MNNYLDLDDASTWDDDFFDLFNEENIWEYILNTYEGSYSGGKILEQLSYKEESINDEVTISLISKSKRILISKYSHVIGYHGCRIAAKSSYLKNGIQPSNTKALIKFCKELFNMNHEIDEVVKKINRFGYLDHNENKIGFLLSARKAKYDKSQHSLGSELVRSIAYQFGKDYLRNYFETGKPSLIKCKIPVGWLDKLTTYPMIKSYSSDILYQIIFKKLWPEDKEPRIKGGFMLEQGIPPENIIDFIDMTGFNDEESFLT